MHKTSVVALAALAAGAACAQTTAACDPSDPLVHAPAIEYRSPFSDYQPYRDPAIADWGESNRAVGSLGGHAGQLAKPGSPSNPLQRSDPKPPEAAAMPASSGHAGHR